MRIFVDRFNDQYIICKSHNLNTIKVMYERGVVSERRRERESTAYKIKPDFISFKK